MTPTKAEADRIKRVVAYGCIVSRLKWCIYSPPDFHHILDGGRRMGHWYGIALNPWFHRGVCESGMSQRDMTRIYGPSLALDKPAFEAEHGTERHLWEITQRLFGLDRSWPTSKIFRRTA